MFYIANILITVATVFISAWGIYNFVPISAYDLFSIKNNDPLLGSSLTTLNSTDALNNFPTTYNANNTYLNETKVAISSTTWPQLTTAANLTTVGTIVSGTWTGSVIDVARQGTGSTSPSTNYIILGNGSSGFKVVNSLGTAGQFLSSPGSNAPFWSWGIGTSTALAGTIGIQGNLNVSGALHTAGLVATGTIQFNKINYTFPSTQGASGDVLKNDGSGGLSWGGAELSSERVLAINTAGISIQTGSSTRITYSAETFDPSNRLDSNGRFRVSSAGAYLIEGFIGFTPGTSMDDRRVTLYTNSAESQRIQEADAQGGDASTMPYVFVRQLVANDVIEIWALSTDGGGGTYCDATMQCVLHIQKLHD